MKAVEKLFDKIESHHHGRDAWSARWSMMKAKIKQIFSANVHVICCNDGVEAVVIGSKTRAQRKCDAMKKAYIKKHCYYMKDRELEQQKKILYYHLHTVNVYFFL